MKRSRRQKWKGLVALSLLLWLAISTVWVRSYFICDGGGTRAGSGWVVQSWQGRVFLGRARATPDSPRVLIRTDFANVPEHPAIYTALLQARMNRTLRQWSGIGDTIITAPRITFPAASWRNGFGFDHVEVSTPTLRLDAWSVPFWILWLAASILPTLQWSAWRRHRYLTRAGLCRACGYDLRATPDRCPECGAVAPQAAG